MGEQGSSRSGSLRESRQKRMAEWFQGRRWRVCTELSSEQTDVVIRKGEFWVTGGKVFRTPLGNKGTHGYILQEISVKTGQDVWKSTGPGENDVAPSRVPFGWVTIRNASEMFPGSITEVPPRPYGQRGGVAAALAKEGGET